MAEGESNDKPQPEVTSSDPSREPDENTERRGLTREQRRLLGIGRTLGSRSRSSPEAAEPPSAAGRAPSGSAIEPGEAAAHSVSPKEKSSVESAPSGVSRPAARPASVLMKDEKSSRAFEMQKAAIIIGCLFLLGGAFYLGVKVPGWLYAYRSHQRQAIQKSAPEKFPGVSSDELVEEGLVAQGAGRWQEAADRLLEAKRKNNSYRGIFFMVGLMMLEHEDLDTADTLFAAAIASGENQDGANSFRAKIAMRRHDYAAAERFAEAATVAAPFVWTNYYEWGEILRMNHKPREAVRRYEQAARRAPAGFAIIGSHYKARLARIEARDATIGEEIARRKNEGTVSPEWLVTEAALKIDQGHFGDAAQLLTEARAATTANTFSSYVSDMLFQNASQSDPSLAAICRTPTPAPSP